MTKNQEKMKRYLRHQKLEGRREEQVRLYNFFKSDLKKRQKLGKKKEVSRRKWLKRKQKPGGRQLPINERLSGFPWSKAPGSYASKVTNAAATNAANGGSTSKKLEVVFSYKHVRIFLKRTLIMYCLPFALISSLSFFFIIYEFKAFSYTAKKLLYGYPDFTHGCIKCPHLWGQWVVTVGTHQMWS